MAVAHGYRERHLPIDDLVIDWFHYTKMGEMDMDPTKWPDPVVMNRDLHAMNFHTMISVWPRFVPESRFYATVLKNGWFEHLADGAPTNGLPYDRAGADIDTTDPAAAKWYWNIIRESYIAKGFDAFWADETEPDLPPNGSFWHIGPGTQFFNVFPLFHTAAFYNGMRADTHGRALILARDAYLGAQHNGAIFWSSDISANWDTLKRQVPTGINFVASGTPYWSTDIGGWQYLPAVHHPALPPLLDPTDARDNVGGYDDYPELYTRWFEYGAFQPNFRSHGSRKQNEVWSYGKEAEPILEKYLRLRYQLMPYIYSLGRTTNLTGAPFMRGLFMDFGSDPNVANIGDEYMFGPTLLVAPVTDQGVTSRQVYPPPAQKVRRKRSGSISGPTSACTAARPSPSPPPSTLSPSSFAPAPSSLSAQPSRARSTNNPSPPSASIPARTAASTSTTTTERLTPTSTEPPKPPTSTGPTPPENSPTQETTSPQVQTYKSFPAKRHSRLTAAVPRSFACPSGAKRRNLLLPSPSLPPSPAAVSSQHNNSAATTAPPAR